MKKLKEYAIVFSIGAIGYSIVEILFRGYTHWSMTLTGGTCFCSLYCLYKKLCKSTLWVKCLFGAVVITSIEFFVGVLVNKVMNLGVWDYSKLRFNVSGQICLLFSTLWFLLCIPLNYLCSMLKKRLCKKSSFHW